MGLRQEARSSIPRRALTCRLGQYFHRRDRLDRLAQAHVVGDETTPRLGDAVSLAGPWIRRWN